MNTKLVPCPNGGKCGNQNHQVGSAAYLACTTAGANAGASGGRVAATAVMTSAGASTSSFAQQARQEAMEIEDHEERLATLMDCDGITFNYEEVGEEDTEFWDEYTRQHRHYKVTFTNEEGQTLTSEFHTARDVDAAEVMAAQVRDGNLAKEYDSAEDLANDLGYEDAEERDFDDYVEEDQTEGWKAWRQQERELTSQYYRAENEVDQANDELDEWNNIVLGNTRDYGRGSDEVRYAKDGVVQAEERVRQADLAYYELSGRLEALRDEEPDRVYPPTKAERIYAAAKKMDRELDAFLGDKRQDYQEIPWSDI